MRLFGIVVLIIVSVLYCFVLYKVLLLCIVLYAIFCFVLCCRRFYSYVLYYTALCCSVNFCIKFYKIVFIMLYYASVIFSFPWYILFSSPMRKLAMKAVTLETLRHPVLLIMLETQRRTASNFSHMLCSMAQMMKWPS